MKKIKFCPFKKIVTLLYTTTSKKYIKIISSLIVLGAICNYSSTQPLPIFWGLIVGFSIVIFIDIYALKKVYSFFEKAQKKMAGDHALRNQKATLEKRIYSNKNWLLVLIIPSLIVPTVIYIIQYPLGLPIKLFAYIALFFIIALCVISYSEYVYFIMFSHDLYKNAIHIQKYNKMRPHKTDWLKDLANLTNTQSNLFFIVGTGFIFLLALITLSGLYGVSLAAPVSKAIVIYLWLIIALGIVAMFPLLSFYSYFFIKALVNELIQKSINKTENAYNLYYNNRTLQRGMELMHLAEIKILLLEKSALYPKKPFICYAASYLIGIINFVATFEAILSLSEHFI